MENDLDRPKLTRRQTLQVVFLVLVVIGVTMLTVIKLILLTGLWMKVREPLKTNYYDHPSHVFAGAFLLLAFIQTDRCI